MGNWVVEQASEPGGAAFGCAGDADTQGPEARRAPERAPGLPLFLRTLFDPLYVDAFFSRVSSLLIGKAILLFYFALLAILARVRCSYLSSFAIFWEMSLLGSRFLDVLYLPWLNQYASFS